MNEEFFNLVPIDAEQLKQAQQVKDRYRLVFQSDSGRTVLADLLRMTHFAVSLDPANAAMIAEYNVGLAVLAKSGLLDDIKTILGMRQEEPRTP